MTPSSIPDEVLVRLRLARVGLDEIADTVVAAGMTFDDTFKAMVAFAVPALTAAQAGRAREADQALAILAADGSIPDDVYAAIRNQVLRALTAALAHVPPGHKPH